MFGETISLMESLQITLLGMSVVFMVLVLLMVIIVVMERAVHGRPSKKVEAIAPSAPQAKEVEQPVKAGDDLELVAVIAAAAASSMGVQPSNLIIRNIVRMPETAPAWNLSGRSDLMASRSMK